jgi:hypothetical protein
MNLQELIELLKLRILTEPKDFNSITPTTGYTSDLLSCVMTGAQTGGLWITLQSHVNIVAVGALIELSAIIITENAMPDENTIVRANEQGIALLLSEQNSYQVCGLLWEQGLRS